MSPKKSKQSDSVGFNEGNHTGFLRGYSQGMRDALVVIQNILQHNDIRMAESEFFLELSNLKEEGILKDPHDY
jgi:hypothetical protein